MDFTLPAYGQTSSGKTYTMVGDLEDEDHAGILSRTFQYCFTKAEDSPVYFQLQMMEIYKEEIRDLLGAGNNRNATKLVIRNDVQHGTEVKGLSTMKMSSHSQGIRFVKEGIERRSTAETKMNKASSRSHVLCFIIICDKYSNKGKLLSFSNLSPGYNLGLRQL